MIAKTSYLTAVEAQRYFDGRVNTDAWDRASVSEQEKVLIQASTDIDKIAYRGNKQVAQQEHEFPRLFPDSNYDTTPYDTDNVPLGVKYAVCEHALAILDGFDVNKELDGLSVVAARYSTVQVNHDRSTVPMHLKAGLCAQAWQQLLPFIRDNKSIMLSRVS